MSGRLGTAVGRNIMAARLFGAGAERCFIAAPLLSMTASLPRKWIRPGFERAYSRPTAEHFPEQHAEGTRVGPVASQNARVKTPDPPTLGHVFPEMMNAAGARVSINRHILCLPRKAHQPPLKCHAVLPFGGARRLPWSTPPQGETIDCTFGVAFGFSTLARPRRFEPASPGREM